MKNRLTYSRREAMRGILFIAPWLIGFLFLFIRPFTVAETVYTDAVVCEMAHFGPEQIHPHMEHCLTKHFFFHHIYGMEAALAAEKKWRETMPFPVHLVRDGDAWEI